MEKGAGQQLWQMSSNQLPPQNAVTLATTRMRGESHSQLKATHRDAGAQVIKDTSERDKKKVVGQRDGEEDTEIRYILIIYSYCCQMCLLIFVGCCFRSSSKKKVLCSNEMKLFIAAEQAINAPLWWIWQSFTYFLSCFIKEAVWAKLNIIVPLSGSGLLERNDYSAFLPTCSLNPLAKTTLIYISVADCVIFQSQVCHRASSAVPLIGHTQDSVLDLRPWNKTL